MVSAGLKAESSDVSNNPACASPQLTQTNTGIKKIPVRPQSLLQMNITFSVIVEGRVAFHLYRVGKQYSHIRQCYTVKLQVQLILFGFQRTGSFTHNMSQTVHECTKPPFL